MTEPDFELFTSLRYDPKLSGVSSARIEGWNASKSSPLYMLDYHRDRMLRAATYFGWTDAIAAIDGDAGLARLEDFILGLPEIGDHPLRVKVTLSKAGKFGHEAGRVPEQSLSNLFPPSLPPPGQEAHDGGGVAKSPTYRIFVDLDQTPPSEYTHYKTTRREMYNSARQRMGIGATDTAEVLLVNTSDGSIMEGSLVTPYFWKNGRWVTPPVPTRFSREQSGGQDGTTRRWALERRLCVEEPVKASSLVEGEECWISNGVRGFNFGKVTLAK
ncbi:hypothetical protein PpBr36_08160 [Pyricularia pennisetigena]|uniref:hypothetical protein n=1 Tax=Pyricularia pennisetigena TaxID=1578925 RepID=UPI001151C719|nr:hypothetical protein PpBr36_08160 [Pyricularia pennisetigena]TLS24712.1 hypothetical protein PpBr36_08160 [Pyricularia pennisetigena]